MTVRTRRAVLEFIRSPKPTAYQVRDLVSGEISYVRCAVDALLYPLLTGKTVEISARPPGLTRTLTFVLGPEAAGPWPEGWVLAYPELPIESEDFDRIARERCPYVHLFPDAEALNRWLSGLPAEVRDHVRVFTLVEAVSWARIRVESWPES